MRRLDRGAGPAAHPGGADAQALARGEPLPASQQAALEDAGLLVLNMAEGLQADVRQRIAQALPAVPGVGPNRASFRWNALPGLADARRRGCG